MVDFCISEVRYDEKNEHIEWLKVHERQTKGTAWYVGPMRLVPRAFVADLIRLNKASFETIVKNASNQFIHGAHVHVIDGAYLTTDRNNTKRDNLGRLPVF
jgi:hypothetical protein